MKQEPLFYINRAEEGAAGPYDLAQMADLLDKKSITAETMARVEGEDGWKPFALLPQFNTVQEMCHETVPTPYDAPDQAASAPHSLIPLPSRKTIFKLGMGVLLTLVVGGISYAIARFNPTVGMVLVIMGLGVSAVAHSLILGRMCQKEGYMTIAMVFCIPLFDIYYYLSNIGEYFPYLCAKYGGVVVALAALAGLPNSSSY